MSFLPDWVAEGLGTIDFSVLAPELVLAATGFLVLLVDIFVRRERKRLLSWLALAGVLVAVYALAQAARGSGVIGGGAVLAYADLFVFDGFAVFLKFIFLTATFLTILMSVRFLDEEGAQRGEYYALICFATVGMMFMASGNDLFAIFVGLELMALSTYVLVGYLREDMRSNESAMKYFIVGAFGSGFFLYGLTLFYGSAGTTKLPQLGEALEGRLGEPVVVMGLITLSVGLAFKVAAVPFHAWAPDVYQGAPTPITAYISVASKAAGFAVVVRVLLVGLWELQPDWHQLLWLLAAASMTLGNVVAIVQPNTKRMLAYSSIAHAGYILLAVVSARAGNERLAVAGVLVYLLAYTFMNVGAFSLVALLRRRDIVGDEVRDFAGLMKRSPFAAVLMTIFLLSLAGIPPTAGFVGKLVVFMAAIEAGEGLLVVIAVLNTAISLYYYFRIVVSMWMDSPREEVPYAWSAELVATLVIAALGTMLVGIWPRWWLDLAQSSVLQILP